MNSIKKEGKPTETIVASTVCLKKSKKLLYITFRVVTTFILFEQILYEITWSPFAKLCGCNFQNYLTWSSFSKLLYVVVIFKITLRGRHFQNYSTWSSFSKLLYVVATSKNYLVANFKTTWSRFAKLRGHQFQNYFMWSPFAKLLCCQ